MIDGRNRPYDDGSDHQRRRHPAVDRGHQVLRDTQGGAGGYVLPGYDQPSYGQPGYQPAGYEQSAYDQPNYEQPNYEQPSYGQPGYDQPGYGAGAYPPPPYGEDTGYAPSFIERGFDEADAQRPRRDPAARRARPADGTDPYAAPGFAQAPDYQTDPRGARSEASRLAAGRRDARVRGNTDPRGNVYGDPGYDSAAYDGAAYDSAGYDSAGYDNSGFDNAGYDSAYGAGYDNRGYDSRGAAGGPPYQGYDNPGYEDPGYDNSGYRNAAYDNGYEESVEPIGVEKRRRRGRSAMTLALVFVILAACGGVGVYGYRFYQNHFTTPDYSGQGSGTVLVVINSGDSATAIGDTLTKDGVTKSTKAFIVAAGANVNSRKIQAGTYSLHKQMSGANAVLALLATNADGTLKNLVRNGITIIEGMISIDIFNLLHTKTGVPLADFTAAAKNPAALGVPAAFLTAKGKLLSPIEGFLYPDTYNFTTGMTAKQMLTKMVGEFNTQATKLNIVADAHTLGLTPFQVIITASILQAEAQTPQDMAGVAEVIYNRIYRTGGGDSGSKLEIDSETNYWLRMTGHSALDSSKLTYSQILNKSDPYNTHLNVGLPPGALGNPGSAAINAALHPDTSKRGYYYWQTVKGKSGVVFSKTYSQFRAAQK